MTENKLKVKKLISSAKIPLRATEFSAGYDIFSVENVLIPRGQHKLIKTGIAIECPPGTYARIAPRSSLALKNGIHIGAGVIDPDYRGEIGVIMFNLGADDFEVRFGDKIAQIILEKFMIADVEEVQELAQSDRGSKGFGSSGK
ncbi:MAG: dUTP diphosphatase [Candidatus Aenigmatarchaeota archaeon]|jgi:dUTP pyrophosphatase